jgi:hypothetical protein
MTEAHAGVEPGDDRDHSFTSLKTLRAHQRDLRDKLLSGFANRTELLLWQHDVAAKTIGQIPDDWHRKFVTDRWLSAAMLADYEQRAVVSSRPPADVVSQRRRHEIIHEDLMPAMQSAIREFRQLAVQYIEDPSNPVDMGRQEYIAMRPQLDEVVREQRFALEWALDAWADEQRRPPISTRSDALAWADQVIYATYGHIGDEFTDQVISPSSEWLPALTSPASVALKLLLSTEILPAMNETIRYVVSNSKEVSAEEREERGPTPV